MWTVRPQKLDVSFRQLCALEKIRSSSAWTLATQEDVKAVFVETFDGQDLGAIVRNLGLFAKLTWTENREYTGLWSENLDSPLI